MVKLTGGGFRGKGTWLLLFAILSMLYAVIVSDVILLSIGMGVLLLSNTLHVYIGKKGVVVGGTLYKWNQIEKFDVQSPKSKGSLHQHTVQIKWKHSSRPASLKLTEEQLHAVRELGLPLLNDGPKGRFGN